VFAKIMRLMASLAGASEERSRRFNRKRGREMRNAWVCLLGLAIVGAFTVAVAWGQQAPKLTIHWDQVTLVSKTTPTLQVVVNPPLRPGQPLGAAAYKAVKELGANDVRYVPWLPYPKLAVAELQPPTAQKTSWNFSLIDPMTKEFFAATEGHPTVMNFSTIPQWLFKTDKPVTYPADPNQVDWHYEQGTELRDPSGKELGNYYARLVSWYVDGGFTDEDGVRHESGYHYKIPIWEVLNEVEFEHKMTPEQYTRRYDAIVSAIQKVSPATKYMGMALASPGADPQWFEYFLNHANHLAGIPIDYISYHFYASPTPEEKLDDWQYTFFDQADGFLNTVRYAETIRKRLSPDTKTDLDELGVILPTDNKPGDNVPPPHAYWNLCGSLYAYEFIELSNLQVNIAGMSQLVGYPTQFPSVSMMDWTQDEPNARYSVLKLIKDTFHPGDKLVKTEMDSHDVAAQAFVTPAGRRLLLANERDRTMEIALPDASTADAHVVDEQTGDGPAREVKPVDGKIELGPFAVAVVNW
jgi:Glycosyl hydrolases family 39